MSASIPAPEPHPESSPEEAIPVIAAPTDLIEEYLSLVDERRSVEERLAFVRAELELAAAGSLKDATPRGRFVGEHGMISVRLQPTCIFDRAGVARELQRMGKLSDVAVLQGPGLARYLGKEPAVAARLGSMVRMRKSIVLTAGQLG